MPKQLLEKSILYTPKKMVVDTIQLTTVSHALTGCFNQHLVLIQCCMMPELPLILSFFSLQFVDKAGESNNMV